jgi:hypothetical protein
LGFLHTVDKACDEEVPVATAVMNILIGLVTSVVSGISVWVWQKGRRSRLLRRRTAFFSLGRGRQCLIMMPDKYDRPGSVARHDVHAMIEVATLAHDLGSPVSVMPADNLKGHNGDRTEFCIGGPISNPRSSGHLAAELPGVEIRPYQEGAADSMAIVVGRDRFLCERRNREHVLIAKFIPKGSTCPVIVISGQTAIANRAGIVFLKREYRALTKSLSSTNRFCIVVVANSIGAYGHEATSLAADVTVLAFTPIELPAPAGVPATTRQPFQGQRLSRRSETER